MDVLLQHITLRHTMPFGARERNLHRPVFERFRLAIGRGYTAPHKNMDAIMAVTALAQQGNAQANELLNRNNAKVEARLVAVLQGFMPGQTAQSPQTVTNALGIAAFCGKGKSLVDAVATLLNRVHTDSTADGRALREQGLKVLQAMVQRSVPGAQEKYQSFVQESAETCLRSDFGDAPLSGKGPGPVEPFVPSGPGWDVYGSSNTEPGFSY